MTRTDPTPLSPTRPTHDAELPNHAEPPDNGAMRQLATKVSDLTSRAEQWRGQTEALRDGAAQHIRAHPVRSVLIATGTGVALAWLLRALSR